MEADLRDDAYFEVEMVARREASLKRALAMRHKPHNPIGKRMRVESRKRVIPATRYQEFREFWDTIKNDTRPLLGPLNENPLISAIPAHPWDGAIAPDG